MEAGPTRVTTVVIERLETTNEEEISPLPSQVHLPPAQPDAPTITTLPERRGSRLTQGWTKPEIHRWRSPLLMILFFTLGLSVSIAHCIFYPQLKGEFVGNSGRQEQNLRFGTAFAFLAQICLGAAVWTAYTQILWRSVQRKSMTVAAWNCAFGADTSVFSLLNWEMLRKIRVGSAMALFAWSLLLPPFFTPATLFIYESIDKQEVYIAMPYPSIANASAAHKFSYSPPIRRGTVQLRNDTSRMFAGSRTALNLISAATSSLGQILPIDLPYNDSAYSVSFYAPIVKCNDANETNVARIDAFLREEMSTVWDTKIETDNTYFAFVPTYNSTNDLTAIWRPRQQSPSRSLNQLWMTFLRATINSTGARVHQRHYQICQLYNASYSLSISQYHGVQSVSGNYTASPSPIPFPTDTTSTPSNMAQRACAAFMWVMSDQLVGKFAWYDESSTTPSPQVATQFGVIDSPIQRTSLLGSRDLDTFFELDELKGLYANQSESDVFLLSDQRLRDKTAAGNRTLDVLIEELSFNLTVSLMHNPLLTDALDTTIIRTRDVNRYNYKPYGLFIPYALANIFTFVCLAIGIASFRHDGPLPSKKVGDVIWAARNWAVQGRPSLTRTMSMGVGVDEKGDIQIQVVETGEGERARRVSDFESVRWRGSEVVSEASGEGNSERGEGEIEKTAEGKEGGVWMPLARWMAGVGGVLQRWGKGKTEEQP